MVESLVRLLDSDPGHKRNHRMYNLLLENVCSNWASSVVEACAVASVSRCTQRT